MTISKEEILHDIPLLERALLGKNTQRCDKALILNRLVREFGLEGCEDGIPHLREEDDEVKNKVVESLQSALIELKNDENDPDNHREISELRVKIVQAFGTIGSISGLEKLVEDDDPNVAIAALGEITSLAISPIQYRDYGDLRLNELKPLAQQKAQKMIEIAINNRCSDVIRAGLSAKNRIERGY